MRIYNPFKNEVYTSSFTSVNLNHSYTSVVIEDKFEIYYNYKSRKEDLLYCIIINDEEYQKRMFDIIYGLKEYGKIGLDLYSITIKKIAINNKEKILFAVYVNIENKSGESLTKIDYLIEFVEFVNKLCDLKYGLNEELIKITDTSFNSNLLLKSFLFFDKKEEDMSVDEIKKENNSILINIIFKYFYEESESLFDNCDGFKLYDIENMNYSYSVFKMFYDYYVEAKEDIDILETLRSEKNIKCNIDNDCSEKMMSNNFCKASAQLGCCCKGRKASIITNYDNLTEYEKTEEYIIFEDENFLYKIFSNTDDLLLDIVDELSAQSDDYVTKFLNIALNSVLFDVNGTIIGYSYVDKSTSYIGEPLALNEVEFTTDSIQCVITFLWDLFSFLNSARTVEIPEIEKFELENEVYIYSNRMRENKFKLKNEYSYYKADHCNFNVIKRELVYFFLKKYSNYIKNNHNEVTTKTIYDILEFKVLPPMIAKQLISYMFSKNNIDIDCIYYGFFADFQQNYKLNSRKKIIYYDKYSYGFLNTEYIFEEQIKEKLGIDEIPTNTDIMLSDGRCVRIFKRVRELSVINSIIEENKNNFDEIFSSSDNKNIHFVGINTIIFTKNLSSSGMYFVKGYVSDKKAGKPLSEILTSGINNKEFIKIVLKFFSEFVGLFLSFDSLSNVTMDNNYNFYICLLNHLDFKFRPRYEVIDDVIKALKKKDIEIPGIELGTLSTYSREEIIQEYNNLKFYCKDHNMWYSKPGLCPICKKTLYGIDAYCLKRAKIVYEDKYAIHYSLDLDREFYLKIYKKDMLDMKQQEKVIDTMIKNRNENYYLQSYFVPIKKIISTVTREFLGYVYYRVDFDSLKDLDEFKNLLKIKSLILLCMQVQNLQNKNLIFESSPYDKLYFDVDKKREIQIVNIDFINTDFNSNLLQKSEKFLTNYIGECFKNQYWFDGINTDTSLSNLIENLKSFAGDMTKICPIHGIHYHKKYIVCPECHPNFDTSMIDENSIKLDIEALKNTDKIGEGGESVVYEYEPNCLAKIFRKEVNIEFKLNILLKIFEKRSILDKFNKENSKFVFVVPKKIIIDTNTNNIVGYTLDKVDGKIISTLNDKEKVEELGLTKKDVLEILIVSGEGIEYLHKNANIYIGDLNGNNIMFDSDKTVYFIDFDGIGVDDIYPQFFTDRYVDPIARENHTITPEHDWYSFAIQAFYYLTYAHPFSGIYKVDGKILKIVERMERKISLIGHHNNLELPASAISWKWMKKYGILKVFLGIFENDTREDITPYLKKYYNETYDSKFDNVNFIDKSKDLENVSKVDKKVSIEKISLFDTNDYIREIINPFSYTTFDNHIKVIIGSDVKSFPYDVEENLIDVFLSSDNDIIYIVYDKKVEVYGRIFNRMLFSEVFNSSINTKVVVDDRTMYYLDVVSSLNVICKVELYNTEHNKEIINFKKHLKNKGFSVVNNKKFVVVKEDTYYDYIYCNDIKFQEIYRETDDVKYNVLYDQKRHEWLVINTDGKYFIIKGNGEKICLNDNKIKMTSLDRVIFEYGNIYMPINGGLYIINTKKNATKLIDLNIVTKDSKILVKNSAFVIINGSEAYEYKKL